MAWTVVETPNAKYVLIFSKHSEKAEGVPKAFDAVVLEGGGRPKEATSRHIYKNIVKQAVEQGKQVWITDVPTTARSTRRTTSGALILAGSLLGGVALSMSTLRGIHRRKKRKEKIGRRAFIKGAIGLGILSPSIAFVVADKVIEHKKEIKHHRGWDIVKKIGELGGGYGQTTARNLVTAEKCENFLAPRLQQQLGRKPTIAMVWGPGHYGIRNLLLHPKKRQRLLQKYGLEKFVKKDYSKSFKIHLKLDGTVERVEEFKETLRPRKTKPAKKKVGTLSRREFLKRTFGRRKRA